MFSLCLAISIAGLIMTFTGVKGTETSNESLATSPAPTDGLYCMSCFNCKIFEKTSHSVKCDPSSTHCLVFVRADIKSGEVERKCATEQICNEALRASAYTSVHCCSTSHCNTGSIIGCVALVEISLLVALSQMSNKLFYNHA
ncbi:hypothetical protein TCAL_16360 [Tigriopus californicus]|uniref:UPAR/Ly6 domain-containing protein n=1 Tax=Tigriopus californicus TaxID=6832 RepID=A0A553P0H8_TIGCA|nr:hypothetical protein TCAL_16360 [Tigriopus californicus]